MIRNRFNFRNLIIVKPCVDYLRSAYFNPEMYAYGTTCSDILADNAQAFSTFNASVWDFSGEKAEFKKRPNYIKVEAKAYELYTGLNENNQKLANEAPVTIDLSNYLQEVPANVSWALSNNNGQVPCSVSVNGTVLTITGFNKVSGEYTLSGTSRDNSLTITIPVIIADKIIKTTTDFDNMAYYGEKTGEVVNGGTLDGYFVLGNNLDFTGKTIATAVGELAHSDAIANYGFTGTFNGLGYAITGGAYKEGGIFGSVATTGVIKNIAFTDVTLSGAYSAVISKFFHGTLQEVLIDVADLDMTGVAEDWARLENHAVARTMGLATLINCIVYYPAVTTNGTYAAYVLADGADGYYHGADVKAYGTYSIGGAGGGMPACVDYATSPYFNPATYALGTTIAQIKAADERAFMDFDTSIWDFSGDKATFKNING